MSTATISEFPIREQRAPVPEADLATVLIAIVKRHKLLLMSVILLFPALTTWLAFSIRPVYRAEAVLSPQAGDDGLDAAAAVPSRLSGLASFAGLNLRGRGAGTPAQDFLATVNSREFAEAFIRDRQLLTVLFANRWDAQARAWRTDDDEPPPTMADAVAKLGRMLVVEEDLKTGMIRLSIDWTDPQSAADWANDLVDRANEQLRSRTVTESSQAIEVLTKQLEVTELQESRQALYNVLEAQINRAALAKVRRQYAVRIVDHAAPPQLDDFVKPRRPLLIAAGVVVGLTMASVLVGLVLVTGALRARWRAV